MTALNLPLARARDLLLKVVLICFVAELALHQIKALLHCAEIVTAIFDRNGKAVSPGSKAKGVVVGEVQRGYHSRVGHSLALTLAFNLGVLGRAWLELEGLAFVIIVNGLLKGRMRGLDDPILLQEFGHAV